MAKEFIQIRKLTPEFYAENQLIQMLDENKNKGRGFGVLLTEIRGYKFAIPFRSNIRREDKFCFETLEKEDVNMKMGLDYTKAVIIKEERYIIDRAYFLKDKRELVKVRKNARTITGEFGNFVEQYIQAVKDNDREFLGQREIKYTTLQNYHTELGL